VTDWRNKSYITYKLQDILFILVCGNLCGLRDPEEILDYVDEHWDVLSRHVEFAQPPCLTTLTTIIGNLNPNQLELCLHGIFRNVYPKLAEEYAQLSVDGKTICGENSVHIVMALNVEDGVCAGQMVVDEKTNEIPAVQELLGTIDIKNRVISMDAMHCQAETIKKIIERKGHYVVQVKKNQKGLYEDIEGLFKLGSVPMGRTLEKGHGRIEKRICRVLPNFSGEYFKYWHGLKTVFAIERKVWEKDVERIETSYYLSSCAADERLLRYARDHWKIESFHWIMDTICGEDGAFLRNKNAQVCMSIIRKFAISMMKKYIEHTNPKKNAISANMRRCAFNAQNLEKVLAFFDFV